MPEGLDALDGLVIVTCLVLGFGVVKLIIALHRRRPGEGNEEAKGDDRVRR